MAIEFHSLCNNSAGRPTELVVKCGNPAYLVATPARGFERRADNLDQLTFSFPLPAEDRSYTREQYADLTRRVNIIIKTQLGLVCSHLRFASHYNLICICALEVVVEIMFGS